MDKIHISNVDHIQNDWLRVLDFYKSEISILRKRLTEIAGKNTGHEVNKGVEHFENQFKLQDENIDFLKHDINSNVSDISRQVRESTAGYIDASLIKLYRRLQEKYVAEEKLINELRHDFYQFAMKWM